MDKFYVRKVKTYQGYGEYFHKEDWNSYTPLDGHKDELYGIMNFLKDIPYIEPMHWGTLWEFNIYRLKIVLKSVHKKSYRIWVKSVLDGNGPDYDEMLEIWDNILSMAPPCASYIQLAWVNQ